MAYVRSILCGLGMGFVAACSSGASPNPNPTPVVPQYPGDDLGTKPKQCDFHDPTACLQACSPAECYPGSNIGYTERKVGNPGTPGNRIPNLRFLAHNNLDTATKTPATGELKTVQLSDFYDPTGTKFRVIRIVVGATWCGPCNQEADFIVQNKIPETLAPEGGVFLQALSEGPSYDPATPTDLNNWITNHALNFTAGLDSDNKLGPFWKSNGIPENITVDARSMEILSKEAGFSMGILTQVQNWINWTKNNPPQAL
jgi:hypothetical protein